MKTGRHHSRFYVATVAALAVFLQSFFMSFAVAAEPMRDAFGNVLCITSGDEGGKPLPGHAQLPECCTVGCTFAGGSLFAPPEMAFAVMRHRVGTIGTPQLNDDVILQPPGHDPGAPRGPPLFQS